MQVVDSLAVAGLSVERVSCGHPEWDKSLLSGETDVFASPLHQLPISLPEGIVITALSARSYPADWLLIHPAAQEVDQLLGLKKQATVYAQDTCRRAQMYDFRADLQFDDQAGDAETALVQLLSGELDAALLPAAMLDEDALTGNGIVVVRFNPKELVPAPGQGVWAYVCCKEDIVTRRALKAIHHSETAVLTNIERGALRLLGAGFEHRLGVYAECDQLGNFHVWAALAETERSPLRRARLSSSTKFHLAERIAQQF